MIGTGLALLTVIVVFVVLPLTIGWPYDWRQQTTTKNSSKPPPPQKEEPKTRPCDVCGTDPNVAALPECQFCPIPEMPPVNSVGPPMISHPIVGPPIEVSNFTGCTRFVGMPPAAVKFPQTADGTSDSKDWTVMFWVKINDLDIPETTIMKKGTSDLSASPAIVYGRGPEHKNPCLKFNFTTQGSPGIMSIDPLEANVPARLAGSYSSLCPNFTSIIPGTWKFMAWTQRGQEMTFYDGDYIWMYSPNTPVKLSQGNLQFDNAGGLIELKNVAVCNRALLREEIVKIYNRESKKEGISPVFQKLISVGPYQRAKTPLHRRNVGRHENISPTFQKLISVGPYQHQNTLTYRKKHEGISGTFYELIEVENFGNQRRLAMMRALAGLQRI